MKEPNPPPEPPTRRVDPVGPQELPTRALRQLRDERCGRARVPSVYYRDNSPPGIYARLSDCRLSQTSNLPDLMRNTRCFQNEGRYTVRTDSSGAQPFGAMPADPGVSFSPASGVLFKRPQVSIWIGLRCPFRRPGHLVERNPRQDRTYSHQGGRTLQVRDRSPIRILADPEIAKPYGGGISVRGKESALVPEGAIYRVHLTAGAGPVPAQLRGQVRIEGRAESLVARGVPRFSAEPRRVAMSIVPADVNPSYSRERGKWLADVA